MKLTYQIRENTMQTPYNNSIDRLISLLKVFTPSKPELKATELHAKTKIPRTTAYRILRSLTAEGWLEKKELTGNYSIGPGLYALGILYLSSTDLVRAASDVTKAVNELTHEAVSVNVLSKRNSIIILREESRHSIRWAIHAGAVLPAHATATGKALLADLPELELEALYPDEELEVFTAQTIPTRTALKSNLAEIRNSGIAIHSEESAEGVFSVASVIRNNGGRAVGAFSIAVPIFRITDEKRALLSRVARISSLLISLRLGYNNEKVPIRSIKELRSWWKLQAESVQGGQFSVEPQPEKGGGAIQR